MCKRDPLFFLNTFCIAAGTLVVTDSGLVPIEYVTSAHRVWDGQSWISQDGALYQGRKDVIFAYGIHLTPDHKVLTNHGWQIASLGYERAAVRIPDCTSASGQLLQDYAGGVALSMRMRKGKDFWWGQPATGPIEELWVQGTPSLHARPLRDGDLQHLDWDERSVSQSEECGVGEVWRARNTSLQAMVAFRELSVGHGRCSDRSESRSDQQRRQLRTQKLSLGDEERTGEQHAEEPDRNDPRRSNVPERCCETSRNNELRDGLSRSERHGRKEVDGTGHEGTRQAAVYDLINCGPRRAFTVIDANGEPLLVHNCWLYEPRPDVGDGLPERRPFNTYSHQDDAVTKSLPVLGRRDIGIEKSREQGASWLYMALTLWRWCFYPYGDYMLVSRNAAMVDNLEDRNTLFVKMHFMIKLLPRFLRPQYSRTEMRIVNRDRGGVIIGAATTESVGVGGRVTWAIFDEFGRFDHTFGYEVLGVTAHTTNCRIFISSAFGDSGPFFDVMHKRPPKTILRLRMHWTDHPVQNQGTYTLSNGVLQLKADPRFPGGYPYPEDYEFIEHPRFKTRSPYFDEHLAKAPSDQYVARELEIDYGGSISRVFEASVLDRLIEKYCRPPDEMLSLREFLTSRNVMITDKAELQEEFWGKAQDASIRIWGKRNADGDLAGNDLCVTAADISAGVGASNSTLVGYNARTRVKLIELIHNRIPANEWAEVAVAISKWLNNAWMIWEDRGPGQTFGQRVQVLRYTRVYNERNEASYSKKERDVPGWNPSPENKLREITHYKDGLSYERIINPSKFAVDECRQFIVTTQGTIKHKKDVDAEDAGGKNKFHGDVVIADALAWHMIDKYMHQFEPVVAKKEIPRGSRRWRDQEASKRRDERGRGRLNLIRVRSC